MREKDIRRFGNRLSCIGHFGIHQESLIKQLLQSIGPMSFMWPRHMRFPDLLATSTIERETRYYPLQDNPILLHDENLVDACQAIAESLSRAGDNTPAAFSIFRLCECFVRRGDGHLALQVSRAIFPDDTEGGPVQCLDLRLSNALRRDSDLCLKFIDEDYFKGLAEIQVDPAFSLCCRSFILAHEVSHVLEDTGVEMLPLPRIGLFWNDFDDNEARIDVAGAIYAILHLRLYHYFRSRVNATRLLGNIILVQSILCDLRMIEDCAKAIAQGQAFDQAQASLEAALRPSERRRDFRSLLLDPEVLTYLLEYCRIPTGDDSYVTSLDYHLLRHHVAYADELHACISRMMRKAFEAVWGTNDTSSMAQAYLEKSITSVVFGLSKDQDHFGYMQTILLFVRSRMGKHLTRIHPTQSLNSPSKWEMSEADWAAHRVQDTWPNGERWQARQVSRSSYVNVGLFGNCIAFDNSGITWPTIATSAE